MTMEEFRRSLTAQAPPPLTSEVLIALWWDAKGDWDAAHRTVDSLDTREGMAVHAYLHRKEGDIGNAEYWYRRAGGEYRREKLDEEWHTLVEALLPD